MSTLNFATIENALSDAPATLATLAKKVGESKEDVSAILASALEAGSVFMEGKKYTLTPAADATPADATPAADPTPAADAAVSKKPRASTVHVEGLKDAYQTARIEALEGGMPEAEIPAFCAARVQALVDSFDEGIRRAAVAKTLKKYPGREGFQSVLSGLSLPEASSGGGGGGSKIKLGEARVCHWSNMPDAVTGEAGVNGLPLRLYGDLGKLVTKGDKFNFVAEMNPDGTLARIVVTPAK